MAMAIAERFRFWRPLGPQMIEFIEVRLGGIASDPSNMKEGHILAEVAEASWGSSPFSLSYNPRTEETELRGSDAVLNEAKKRLERAGFHEKPQSD